MGSFFELGRQTFPQGSGKPGTLRVFYLNLEGLLTVW